MKQLRKDKDSELSLESISDLFDKHLIKCKSIQDPKEIEVMELKLKEFSNSISFKDYAQELIYKDAFIQGYLAAFIVTDEEQETINSLTDLGKVLSEG